MLQYIPNLCSFNAQTRQRLALTAATSQSRWFQTAQLPALKQGIHPGQNANVDSTSKLRDEARRKDEDQDSRVPRHVKRNELGVQLLSRKLHSQIFRNISFPAPPPSYVQISKEHLAMHELDPAQGSVLQDIEFDLPPLQGSNLFEHFHRIGAYVAEPWLTLSKTHASAKLPPKPDHWEIQSGWTKYHFHPDGSSYYEHVDFPIHDGEPEKMLTFDVETMPKYHPYAIMACAASENAWYTWISPWILEETEEPQHLIPFGDPSAPRVIVGHNVSYDRGRILEEYNLESTKNRFVDTMALHVAVNGISSHQRPAWMKYRKSKQIEAEQQEEAIEAVMQLMETVDERIKVEACENKKEELRCLYQEMSESLVRLQTNSPLEVPEDPELDTSLDSEVVTKRWEELTSANSLADVAKLHCGISVDKEIRNVLMTSTPQSIHENISEFLDYCSTDVSVTHEVYSVTLPAFLVACPHPVSFAGILTMGSSFLPVNQEWGKYLESAEKTYRDLEDGVQKKLKKLAEDALALMGQDEKWREDPWLSQLDWTPKIAGKSRGIFTPDQVTTPTDHTPPSDEPLSSQQMRPLWHVQLTSDPLTTKNFERILPLILKLSFDGHPMRYNSKEKWHFLDNGDVTRLPSATDKKTGQILSRKHAFVHLESHRMESVDVDLALALSRGDKGDDTARRVSRLADTILDGSTQADIENDPWLRQLDWIITDSVSPIKRKVAKPKPVKPPPVLWPKWYWEATKPRKDSSPGTLEITVRNRVSPLLLRLSWMGWPLCHSHEHGWTFRVPCHAEFKTRTSPLSFYDPADDHLSESTLRGGNLFYKLPHKDGEKANVGSPLGKTFIKYAQNGTLKSPGDEAKEALEMNALCSYWISARDRIINQMVVWQNDKNNLGFFSQNSQTQKEIKWGIILPQVITMGTVTRRAIEKTWLTASNAKKNRVGSELKAMVRAPPGYAIVGADVDSEELWISSCMGDAQFGLHGATAIGWMTLEGTKAAGTDLHSKTAKILNISRDQAKVFNYSRIYGAGMRHAVLLLLQSNAAMLPEQAQKLAENLYASTKGKNTHRTDIFERKFWFGGSESYLFNKLEEIALSDKPQTPALSCGVTYALSKEYLPSGFGTDYLPSRINWVVQSSGVDYLHLLIVSMDYLITRYDINARYLISVHDELRYLVAEEDKYRAALAMQIANLWTRCLFAHKLGMDDLPQGVAFFSAVDVDKVLRKEVYMPCVTPSQPNPIPSGESLDMSGILDKTNGGTLMKDGCPMSSDDSNPYVGSLEGFVMPDCLTHRSPNAAFLRAQATVDFGEVKGLAQQVYGRRFEGGMQSNIPTKTRRQPLGNGDGFDWSETVEKLLNS